MDFAAARLHILAGYPFGERKYSPYKTWLNAVKVAMARYQYDLAATPLEINEPSKADSPSQDA
jgi:hypothetical protein